MADPVETVDAVEAVLEVADDEAVAAVLAAIVQERAGVLTHARLMCASITRMEAHGILGQADAVFVRRVLRNFANDIAIGFHVDGEPTAELRLHLRRMMEAQRG